jgi:serine/threonine protein kinase
MKVVDFPALLSAFRESQDVSVETLQAILLREIEVMRRLKHRNIVQLEETFWEEERLYMCMELLDGTDLLRSVPPGGMDDDVAKDFFFQLCSAVSFCHSMNVRNRIFMLDFILDFFLRRILSADYSRRSEA